MDIHIICLVPTFGRTPALLNNALACFAAQTHPHKSMLIYDDLGTLEHTWCNLPNVYIYSTRERAPSLGEKYNMMLKYANENHAIYDAVAVWDDDDVYLPDYLATHAQTLQTHRWSKPSRIITAYTEPPSEEASAGRFHGSIAMRRELVQQVPWPSEVVATFDQQYLHALSDAAAAGDTCAYGPPQYVYRWQTANCMHSSGHMGGQAYLDYKPQSVENVVALLPKMDADTKRLYAMYAKPDLLVESVPKTFLGKILAE